MAKIILENGDGLPTITRIQIQYGAEVTENEAPMTGSSISVGNAQIWIGGLLKDVNDIAELIKEINRRDISAVIAAVKSVKKLENWSA